MALAKVITCQQSTRRGSRSTFALLVDVYFTKRYEISLASGLMAATFITRFLFCFRAGPRRWRRTLRFPRAGCPTKNVGVFSPRFEDGPAPSGPLQQFH